MAGGLMESFGLPLRELLLTMLFAAAGALLTGNLSRALALRLGAVAAAAARCSRNANASVGRVIDLCRDRSRRSNRTSTTGTQFGVRLHV